DRGGPEEARDALPRVPEARRRSLSHRVGRRDAIPDRVQQQLRRARSEPAGSQHLVRRGVEEGLNAGETRAAPIEEPRAPPPAGAAPRAAHIDWLVYVGRRLLQTIPTLLIIAVLNFSIVQLAPGDA